MPFALLAKPSAATWENGIFASIFGKRDLLAIDHNMLALFRSYVPNMKYLVDM